MILTCPECATHYKAKSTAIGVNGRTVRCRKCTATWFVAAPEDKYSTPEELQLEDIKSESTNLSEVFLPNTPNSQTDESVIHPSEPVDSFQATDRSETEEGVVKQSELNSDVHDENSENSYSDEYVPEERRQSERRRVERRQSHRKRSFGHANSVDNHIEEEQSMPYRNDVSQLSQSPEDETNTESFYAKTADAIMRDRADEAKLRARLRIIRIIWAIPLTLIGLIFMGLFFARQAVVQTFPGTAPIYAAIGLKVSPTGLLVDPPIIKTARVNGVQTIIINGSVKNITKKTKTLPPLILSLHNAQGESVAEWWVEFNVQTLEGQQRVEFASDYPNPPLDSKELRYRLGFDALSFQ